MANGEIEGVFLGLNTRLRKFKQNFGEEFLERVKARTPVSEPRPNHTPGNLKKSWGFTMKQSDIEIWNIAEYASYVENGTPRMAPRGMLRVTVLESDQIAEVAMERSK